MSATIDDEILPDAGPSPAEVASPSDNEVSNEQSDANSDANSARNSLIASDSFDDSSFENDSTDSEPRPRFQGSRQKWRRLTRSDRELAASLDALDADNLSIHLYNIHALKKKLRPASDAAQDFKSWRRKDRWVAPANKDEWVPYRNWTAWPLEPERVPRPWENFSRTSEEQGDPDLIKKPPEGRDKPSHEMEECLVAETLKQARQQFYATRAVPSEPQDSAEPARKKRKTMAQEDSSPVPLPANEQEASTAKIPHEGLTVDSAMTMDEEEAHKLLRPAIRHILAKFDDLLTALHRSRVNHVENYVPESGSEPDSNEPLSDAAESSTAGSSSKSSSKRRKGKTRRSEAGIAYFLPRLRPRDWSEVLGTAALTGWDADVVQRASARCSELFGESMDFETLHEGGDQMPRANKQTSSTRGLDDNAENDEVNDQDSSQHHVAPDWHYTPGVGALVCPVPSCKWYKCNFNGVGKLTAHMKTMHSWDPSKEPAAGTTEQGEPELDSSADEMYGGIHVDGFMKPITMRAEWVQKHRFHKKHGPRLARKSAGGPSVDGNASATATGIAVNEELEHEEDYDGDTDEHRSEDHEDIGNENEDGDDTEHEEDEDEDDDSDDEHEDDEHRDSEPGDDDSDDDSEDDSENESGASTNTSDS